MAGTRGRMIPGSKGHFQQLYVTILGTPLKNTIPGCCVFFILAIDVALPGEMVIGQGHSP